MNRRFLILSALSSLLAATLMRVLSCEIGFLGYFQNYLLTCPLVGLGIGFLNAGFARMKLPESRWFVSFVVVLVLVAIGHFTVLPYMGAMRDGTTFFLNPQFIEDDLVHEFVLTAVVLLVFTLIIRSFLSLGSAMAVLLEDLGAGRSLVLVTLGGVIGWAIYGVSLSLSSPPVVLVGLIGFCFLLRAGHGRFNIVLVALAVSASFACNFFVVPAGETRYPPAVRANYPQYFKSFWTPEGHVQTFPFVRDGKLVGFGISTNQCAADFAIDTSLDPKAAYAATIGHECLKGYFSGYFTIPYLGRRNPEKILVLAAGSGNEVAEALRLGVKHVDALDWRPWMFKLGELHPAKPFASPAVRKIVSDPRQFLKESSEKYDIIVFGRLEGLSSFSPFGILRTDDFRYTLESFIESRDNLASGGFIALSCKPYLRWYAWRLAHGLQLGHGHVDAILELPFRGYMFASREKDDALAALLGKIFKPTEFLSVEEVMKYAKDIRPTFDDWPFLYAARPSLPVSNLYCMVLLMVATLVHLRPLLRADSGHNGAGQPPAPLFTRRNWRVMLLAAASMVAAGKLVMTVAFNFGTGWQIAMAGAVLVSVCAFISAAVASPARRLPGMLLWTLAFLAYWLEYTFNYESVVTIANPGLRLLAAGFLPLAPLLFVSLTLVRNIIPTPAPKPTFAMLFIGLAIGNFVEHACLFSTISDLGVVGIILCAAAAVILPKRSVVPAEVQRDEPLV